MSVQSRARRALSARLLEILPADAGDQFVGDTHTLHLEENLVPGLSAEQVGVIRRQLEQGAGQELRPTSTGKRPAHAPYSSAVLAVNAFGRWIGQEGDLRVDRLGGFSRLEVESPQQISHGGGRAFLDCLLRADGTTVGVESKLTETLVEHSPTPWKPAYEAPALADLLEGEWRDVFAASRSGEWQPSYLGLEQLIKHALALRSRFPEDELHLVYLWWEPTNGDDFAEVLEHRSEIEELRARIGTTSPTLHTLTYAQLLSEWDALPSPEWVREHVAQLGTRYEVAI